MFYQHDHEVTTRPMGFVLPPDLEMSPPPFPITNAQSNSVPLLLGVMEDMGLRPLLDTHVTPHGAWQGASVGTVVRVWLWHILAERAHRLVAVRDWVAERPQTFNTVRDLTLRETDCTDDRLATVLTMVGEAPTRACLDAAMLQQWGRVSRLPTETIRLDSPRVSVSHDPSDPASVLHQGHSKDPHPDVRQCKALLATLAPLGLPLVCQPVAGHRADDGLYVSAYEAAVRGRGTSQGVVVGESTRGALATRGHIVAGQSASLGASRPPAASAAWATWREQALARSARWQCLEHVDPTTGDVLAEVMIDAWEREQHWLHPVTQGTTTGTERVLVVRAAADQTGRRRRRERALARLTEALVTRWSPPGRGRKRSRSREPLARTGAERIAGAGVTGGVQTTVSEEPLPDGPTRWLVAAGWVHLAAWQALVERLGWQVDVTTTTPAQSPAPALVTAYHQHVLAERGFRRLQSRNLPIRPVSLRDETRIAGVLWLLCLAVRVLTLTE